MSQYSSILVAAFLLFSGFMPTFGTKTYDLTLWDHYYNPSTGEAAFEHKFIGKGTLKFSKNPENETIFIGEIENPYVEEVESGLDDNLFPPFIWINQNPIENVTFEFRFDPELKYAFRLQNPAGTRSAQVFINWLVEALSFAKFIEEGVNRGEQLVSGSTSSFFGFCSRTFKQTQEGSDLVVKIDIDPSECTERKDFYKEPKTGDYEKRILVFGVGEGKKYLKDYTVTIEFAKGDLRHEIGWKLTKV